jgi:CheY-like chemotaxis protein
MSTTNKPLTRDQFDKWVHSALGHLYDAAYLQRHPLGKILMSEESHNPLNRSQGLRRILLDAIQSMRPEPGRPALSPDWRAYRILELRYIEGLNPAEVMEELKIAKSQFFRDQARILDALVDILWNRAQNIPMPSPTAEGQETLDENLLVRSETGRLLESASWEILDVADLVTELQPIINPLITSQGAEFLFDPSPSLRLHADRVMLRQVLLKLITHALSITRDKRIHMAAYGGEKEMGIRLSTAVEGGAADAAVYPGLEISVKLMTAMGGRLHLPRTAPQWEAELIWPVTNPRILLIVDDNAKIIELFRRYLDGQDWVVKGATSGAEAWQKIAESEPAVIMLDVMMPAEDGWEVLVKFKKDPRIRAIPVVICSVVQEPQLARSLGAAGYLPKPVSQMELLTALAPYSIPETAR